MHRRIPLLLFGPIVIAAGCAPAPDLFLEQNARAHIGMLAGTIGSRPVGTPANARARAYIVDQLTQFGFEVRVQEADARRPELGRSARVSNIIATLPGSRPEAVGLIAHYDSVPAAPGATDDGLGVAVALEAGRVVAARAGRTWTLMVLLTDGEEAGLMGAAALMTDREVTRRLQAYVQVESIGSAGPALLFESGPGNSWLLSPWARRAPHPRGASYAVEIYQRLPNDTDFSIIKRQGIPGLNFAPVGDSYAYHTARDTPERLSPETIRTTGENVVSIVRALDGIDVTRRSATGASYFDLFSTAGVTYGPAASWLLAAVALVTAVIGWVRITAAAVRIEGLFRWIMTFVWSAIGAVLVIAAMVGATWALRETRAVYHPWYARPDRLLFLLLTVGIVVGWSVSRVGQWLPARVHGLRHPLTTWSVALPVWIALTCLAMWFAPGAAYLWVVPLASAGILLSAVPPTSAALIRIASALVFLVTAALWARDTVDIFRFLVATLGRLPVITPVYVFAGVLGVAGAMLVPPLVGALVRSRRLLRPSAWTAVALLGLAVAYGAAYRAPAYTHDAPLRRQVRAFQASPDAKAVWEVGSTEPGLDLAVGAPAGWTPAAGAPAAFPAGRLLSPFVFRTEGPPLGPAPLEIAQYTVQPLEGGVELTIAVTPREPGLTVSFVLPPGLTPSRHNLPGIERAGAWTAAYVAVPPDGVLFRASFPASEAAAVGHVRVIVSSPRLPGGSGWQGLPDWLPQDRAVWTSSANWIVPMPVAPVPPLRYYP